MSPNERRQAGLLSDCDRGTSAARDRRSGGGRTQGVVVEATRSPPADPRRRGPARRGRAVRRDPPPRRAVTRFVLRSVLAAAARPAGERGGPPRRAGAEAPRAPRGPGRCHSRGALPGDGRASVVFAWPHGRRPAGAPRDVQRLFWQDGTTSPPRGARHDAGRHPPPPGDVRLDRRALARAPPGPNDASGRRAA